jgi:hypothetical protein
MGTPGDGLEQQPSEGPEAQSMKTQTSKTLENRSASVFAKMSKICARMANFSARFLKIICIEL